MSAGGAPSARLPNDGGPMQTRAQQLRARDRKVLAWSLGVAAVLHVLAFWLLPGIQAQPVNAPDVELRRTPNAKGGERALVAVLFGPPSITEQGGGVWTEPSDRVLKAARLVSLPRECITLVGQDRTPIHGRVHLQVDAGGLAANATMAESTGDACGDKVLALLAGDLWYHWLPTKRFPAPVDLVQPVTLADVRF